MTATSPRVIPPRLTPAELDAYGWSARTPTLRALDFTFRVRTSDPSVCSYLTDIFETFRVVDELPALEYSLIDLGEGVAERWQGYFGGQWFASTDDPGAALRYLLWHVNSSVVETSGRYTLVHAGGLELDGQGVLMPAVMESGKTTTTAGLLRRGMRYLSDEIVAVEPRTLRLVAYPRPLTVEPGSFAVLADLTPPLAQEQAVFATGRWDLRPLQVRPGSVAVEAEPRLVVTPRYQQGATTRLEPMGTTETAAALARSTFELARAAPRDLDVHARLARRCQGYRLTIGDLGEACDLVLATLDKAGP